MRDGPDKTIGQSERHRPRIDWPALENLRSSETSGDVRRKYIGGSDANTILSGDSDRIRSLYLEKRGEQQPEDLSDKLQVMLGCWTEPFNRHWYERLSGQKVSRVGEHLRCAAHDWRRCTLDGFIENISSIWEAKHTSAFAKADEVLERYMPQLQHNMAVARCDRAVLSVIFGNHKFETFEIAADWLYQQELLDAEADFWDCVATGRQPVPKPVPAAPRPFGTRELCLDGNNSWASAAGDWLDHRRAAKIHASAATTIKSLIEEDVSRAFGHGIEAKRSKSGAITIRELAV